MVVKTFKEGNTKNCGLCGVLLKNPRVITSHNIMRYTIWEEQCQRMK